MCLPDFPSTMPIFEFGISQFKDCILTSAWGEACWEIIAIKMRKVACTKVPFGPYREHQTIHGIPESRVLFISFPRNRNIPCAKMEWYHRPILITWMTLLVTTHSQIGATNVSIDFIAMALYLNSVTTVGLILDWKRLSEEGCNGVSQWQWPGWHNSFRVIICVILIIKPVIQFIIWNLVVCNL
jgi:hypothetical protein